jgi:hypothetical protein
MSLAPAATEHAKAPDPNFVSVFQLMNKLERDAEKKVMMMHKTSIENGATNITVGERLLKIMEQGTQEFKQGTGRNMTYSEMRYMYG